MSDDLKSEILAFAERMKSLDDVMREAHERWRELHGRKMWDPAFIDTGELTFLRVRMDGFDKLHARLMAEGDALTARRTGGQLSLPGIF